MLLNRREGQAVFHKVIERLTEEQNKRIAKDWENFKNSADYLKYYTDIQNTLLSIRIYNNILPDNLKARGIYFGNCYIDLNQDIQKSCEEVISTMFDLGYSRYNSFRKDIQDEIILRSRNAESIDQLIDELVSYFLNKDNERNNKMVTKSKT